MHWKMDVEYHCRCIVIALIYLWNRHFLEGT